MKHWSTVVYRIISLFHKEQQQEDVNKYIDVRPPVVPEGWSESHESYRNWNRYLFRRALRNMKRDMRKDENWSPQFFKGERKLPEGFMNRIAQS